MEELDRRLEMAGVDVIDARLTHLAYAPEIAQAMLRRQQAEAIIAARKKIVEGAVGMVDMAVDQLSRGRQHRARRRAQGRDGHQPHGGALRRERGAARGQHRHALQLGRPAMAKRKQYPLRIDPDGLGGHRAMGRG